MTDATPSSKNLTTNVGNRFQEYCHRIGDAELSQFEIYAAGYDQALADMCSADETKAPVGYEDIEGELERVTARLNSVWSNCRIVFYPPMDDPRGNYPIEHAPRAGKDMRSTIEFRLEELKRSGQKATPQPEPSVCRQCGGDYGSHTKDCEQNGKSNV